MGPRIKKWIVIIGAALVSVWMVVSTVREFFDNNAIQYFSHAPSRLLYVAAIAFATGVVAMVLDRLSPRTRRSVKLFSWGAAAALLTAFYGWMIHQMASLSQLGPVFVGYPRGSADDIACAADAGAD